RVVDLLPRASLVHFAGHAVFDGDRPERSYLALASHVVGGGRLRAEEIGELRLSRVEVVVLSACSTINPRPTRAGGVAGLAYSFLHAGAPATISTLWDVSDDDVAGLLVAFHRERREGRTSSEALRRAQIQALRSQDPGTSAPQSWAAFTYTGR
ncbi:MAG TPA: CHAT domain-containing protein, partial [Longimicrobiaceae bacterium]|nr:CHAT domain-containing protein [Longimicrobiaceae bacterium]